VKEIMMRPELDHPEEFADLRRQRPAGPGLLREERMQLGTGMMRCQCGAPATVLSHHEFFCDGCRMPDRQRRQFERMRSK
jgi:hypothetical protein